MRERSVLRGLAGARQWPSCLPPFCPPTSAPCTLPGGRNGPKLASEVGIKDPFLRQESVFLARGVGILALFLRERSVFHARVLATASRIIPANKTERQTHLTLCKAAWTALGRCFTGVLSARFPCRGGNVFRQGR
jgi:hypothetical protein